MKRGLIISGLSLLGLAGAGFGDGTGIYVSDAQRKGSDRLLAQSEEARFWLSSSSDMKARTDDGTLYSVKLPEDQNLRAYLRTFGSIVAEAEDMVILRIQEDLVPRVSDLLHQASSVCGGIIQLDLDGINPDPKVAARPWLSRGAKSAEVEALVAQVDESRLPVSYTHLTLPTRS